MRPKNARGRWSREDSPGENHRHTREYKRRLLRRRQGVALHLSQRQDGGAVGPLSGGAVGQEGVGGVPRGGRLRVLPPNKAGHEGRRDHRVRDHFLCALRWQQGSKTSAHGSPVPSSISGRIAARYSSCSAMCCLRPAAGGAVRALSSQNDSRAASMATVSITSGSASRLNSR